MKKRFIKKQMDFAAQIYELMEQKGWSQKDLSEATGVYEQTLSNIMSGHANPTLKTFVKLEEAFDADIVVAPKFYKKALNRKGYTIIRRSIDENFQLDLNEWFKRIEEKIEVGSDKQTTSFEVSGHSYNVYRMSVNELNTQEDLKAA